MADIKTVDVTDLEKVAAVSADDVLLLVRGGQCYKVNGSDFKGEAGEKGAKGDKGDTGATGAQGAKGDTGPQGAKGETGAQGAKGEKGDQGAKGDTGPQGAPGKDGTDGKSAYDVAKEQGYTGTYEQWKADINTATNAKTTVKEAVDAATAATAKANSAASSVETAKANATAAAEKANAAATKAETAVSTIDSAVEKANTAASTAEAAQTKADTALSKAEAANTAMETATAEAKKATEAANTAATKANSAAASVDSAKTAATDAAMKANAAAESVASAISSAKTATDAANASAAKADTATTNANNAASAANTAKTNADKATTAANSAATAANTAKTNAETATANTKTAIANAEKATEAANTAAKKAEDAAANAGSGGSGGGDANTEEIKTAVQGGTWLNVKNGSGTGSVVEGYLSGNDASGAYSHAEGLNTVASGSSSHAEGTETEASGLSSHAQGRYNYPNVNFTDMVGIGTSTGKKNAEVTYNNTSDATDTKNGNKYLIGVGGYEGQGVDDAQSVQKVIADLQVNKLTRKRKTKTEYVVGRAIKALSYNSYDLKKVWYVVPAMSTMKTVLISVEGLAVGESATICVYKDENTGTNTKYQISLVGRGRCFADRVNAAGHFAISQPDSYTLKVTRVKEGGGRGNINVALNILFNSESYARGFRAIVPDYSYADYNVRIQECRLPSTVETKSPYRKFENGTVMNLRRPTQMYVHDGDFFDRVALQWYRSATQQDIHHIIVHQSNAIQKTRHLDGTGKRRKVIKPRRKLWKSRGRGVYFVRAKHPNEKKSSIVEQWLINIKKRIKKRLA